MFEKTLMTLAAAAAIAAAAGVAVVAAAFALYALLVPHVGAAGAAALVAAGAALTVALAGLIAANKARGKVHHAAAADQPDMSLVWRIVEMAKQRPLIAAAAALAAGLFAMRNPAMIALLIKAFLDPPPRPPPKG